MTSSPSRKPLTYSFAIGVLLIVALAILSAANRNAILQRTHDNARFAASLAARQTEQSLFGIHQILSGLDNQLRLMPEKASPHSPAVRAKLLGMLKRSPFLLDILVCNPQGDIVHWTGPGEPPTIRDRDYINVHLANEYHDLFVGNPTLSRVHDDTWFFGISMSSYSKDNKLGSILVAIIDINYFRKLFSSVERPNHTTLVLANAKGYTITRIPGHAIHVGQHVDVIETNWNKHSSVGTFQLLSPFDQQERIVGFSKIPKYKLIAFSSFAVEEVLIPWRRDLLTIIALSIAMLTMLGLIAFRRSSLLSK